MRASLLPAAPLLAGGPLHAQTGLEPPDLSATAVSLSRLVGWSANDGSRLFTLAVQALPDDRTEERLVLTPAGERRFAITTLGAVRITARGKGVRFTFDGTESRGRKLRSAPGCTI